MPQASGSHRTKFFQVLKTLEVKAATETDRLDKTKSHILRSPPDYVPLSTLRNSFVIECGRMSVLYPRSWHSVSFSHPIYFLYQRSVHLIRSYKLLDKLHIPLFALFVKDIHSRLHNRSELPHSNVGCGCQDSSTLSSELVHKSSSESSEESELVSESNS
jgi:hypothetical protein